LPTNKHISKIRYLDFFGSEGGVQWVLSVELQDQQGEIIGTLGNGKEGNWKQYDIEQDEQICGLYGTVSAKGNLVAFGFIV
jgi:hypothetical protein